MSVTSAMFTGVSGLLNNAEALNVTGNNISNVNTIGFKSSRMLFADVLSTAIGANSQLGHGVQIQGVDNLFNQSSMESTTSVTDVAIQGDRFFALAKPATTANTAISGADAYFTRAGSFRMDGQTTAAGAADFGFAGSLVNPEGFVVLDEAGKPIRIPGQDLANVAGVAPAGTKFFQKITGIDSTGVISMLYADASGSSTTYFYSGSAGTVAPTTTYASAIALGTAQIANPPGMDKVGGTLYRATAASGIPAAAATTAWASNGVTEQILSNNLEASNVDMATEFVKMIQTQRAYSANSKTITTADEMTQEVLNLKR